MMGGEILPIWCILHGKYIKYQGLLYKNYVLYLLRFQMHHKSRFLFCVKILLESLFTSLVTKVWKLHYNVTASRNKQKEAKK